MQNMPFVSPYDFSNIQLDYAEVANTNGSMFLVALRNRARARKDIMAAVKFSQGIGERFPWFPCLRAAGSDIEFKAVQGRWGPLPCSCLCVMPLTPTGKPPKYPIELKFDFRANEDPLQRQKSIHGYIWYDQSGFPNKFKVCFYESPVIVVVDVLLGEKKRVKVIRNDVRAQTEDRFSLRW